MFETAERLMGMTDAVWARHANPWSFYTRLIVLPVFALLVWARIWIGPWVWAGIAMLALWVWLNPRAFPPPATLDHWTSRAVMGERVFLARHERPIPKHHLDWGIGLSVVAGIGLLPLAYGLWALESGWTLAGLSLSVGGKLWFCDRMVWLRDSMAFEDEL